MNYVLKIENGIGGSLSLWNDNRQIDFFIGDQGNKRSDVLIENISQLLGKNNIKKTELKRIVYSNYPGSQTGLKILQSVLKGFKTILAVEIVERNLFESIAASLSVINTGRKIVILAKSISIAEYVIFDEFNHSLFSGELKLNCEIDFSSSEFLEHSDFTVYISEENSKILSLFEKQSSRLKFSAVKLEKNLSQYL